MSRRRIIQRAVFVLGLFVVVLFVSRGLIAEEPRQLNFGVIIETFAAPDERPAGLGFDGSHLWLVTDGVVPTLWQLDPVDGSVVESFTAPAGESALGLDHNGVSLVGTTSDPDRIYTADPTDGTMLGDFVSPFSEPGGIVWDGADLWHSATGEALHLVDDTTGDIVRTVPAPGLGKPRGLAWDGKSLWVSDADGAGAGAIYELDPLDGRVKIAFVPVGDPLSFVHGVTYDGKYLWITDLVDDQIHKVELGLHVGLWISGSCPGATQVRVFGETPGSPYAIVAGTALGEFEIPAGACQGARLGLSDPSLLAVLIADQSGALVIDATPGAAVCGRYLQVIDLANCWLSGIGRLPRE